MKFPILACVAILATAAAFSFHSLKAKEPAPKVDTAQLAQSWEKSDAQVAPASHQPGSLLEFVFGSGIVAVGALQNKRSTQDLNLTESVNLPAAAATADTPGIDLVTTTGGRIPNVELRIHIPATANLVDAKSITVTVQDSDDDAATDPYAAVADIGVRTITGAGGLGGDELDVQVKLPIDIKRYVRLHVAVEAAGGDSTDISAELALVF